MRRAVVISFGLALTAGIAAYVGYSYLTGGTKEVRPQQVSVDIPLQARPPAPSALPPGTQTTPPPAEPRRALVGSTPEELARLKPYLPQGSEVATYPVSQTQEKAAFGSADFGQGVVATTVVCRPRAAAGGERPPLTLVLLKPAGGGLTSAGQVQLTGTYIQNNVYDKQAVPFALRDVTGDGRPDIVVTSAVGASLGATLAIFSVEGAALRQVADISGDVLELEFGGAGQPARVVARSRHEDAAVTYEWTGRQFTPTAGKK
ncbi:MAG TPA: hypothetical protein VF546_08355 [Pyrinomonadaceae bacterium]|jgi:hypothetical protein